MINNMSYYHYQTRLMILITVAIMLITPNYLVLGVRSKPRSSGTVRRLLTDFTSPAAAPAEEEADTKWAVLVAGSNGYDNYRHQADICHAYQILKNGGLKDENIVVLMYDDIANSPENPHQGLIINKPGGQDVYAGVPKDYTGEAVTADNLVAVILGQENRVQGGTGKVVKSAPNDHIFIYYADHGGPGVLSMPAGNDLYANDFIDILMQKHSSGTYKSMVVYVEACESGSIFDGLLSAGMNIYVTTASNPSESSYATYCPGEPSVPTEYHTCLGDLYSVSWMEDSDQNREETLDEQYQVVKSRTSTSSHVMQYGDSNMGADMVSHYIGSTMNNYNADDNHDKKPTPSPLAAVEQRQADIYYLQQKVQRALPGSQQMVEAQKKLDETIAHRKHVDRSVAEIGKVLFGAENGQHIINIVRPAGKPLVDDWDCLKALVSTYKTHCGLLSNYGKKYMRAFANMCNAGITKDQMSRASSQVCT